MLVENKPGVLARVAGLFARRGYNIFSLAVAPTEDERFSRLTIVVDADSAPLEQMVKQFFKLIHVVKINELDPRESVERELLLVTVVRGARDPGSDHRAGAGVRRPDPGVGGSADRSASRGTRRRSTTLKNSCVRMGSWSYSAPDGWRCPGWSAHRACAK